LPKFVLVERANRPDRLVPACRHEPYAVVGLRGTKETGQRVPATTWRSSKGGLAGSYSIRVNAGP
jgi:hypothetical protein